ncbi:MAG: hybrid sensor histidine kinase/response regulator [Bacteroidia bacterium]
MSLEQEKICVLYIDDEEHNLFSFKAAFRFHIDVYTALTPDLAFEILAQNNIHIVISDYRMPLMNGVKLLEKVRKDYPKCVRMLLTAFTDIESVIEAVNKGNIFRYIKKPWDEDEMKLAFEEGYQFYITQNQLKQQHEELIEAYRDLDRFVYSVSHDLRSPLTGIYSLTELISNSNEIKEILKFNEYIKINIRTLEDFVKNLLEYYRVKRGSLTISKVNLDDIVEELFNMYKGHLITHQIDFNKNINNDAKTFHSDAVVVSIILQNLISNAIKYQRQEETNKQITVDASIKNNSLELKVSDNGTGIEEEYLDRVYDMFFRASSVATGSGIGLYNTKNAVEKLNGKISIQSKVNIGTTVTVEIPLK